MMNQSIKHLMIVGFLLSFGCNASVEALEADAPIGAHSEPFTLGPLYFRGHEDVTRFGVNFANSLLGQAFWPTIDVGEACDGNEPDLLAGNCATDIPDSKILDHYDRFWWDWVNAGDLQDLHFLRNHVGSGVEGARHTCYSSRARIIDAATVAVQAWQAGDPSSFRYWTGHALPTIQDSFSAAHSTRVGSRLETLVEVCSYGVQVSGVCFHSFLDSDDRIWRSSLVCQINPWNRSWSCLKPQARSAAYATAGFLRLMAQHVLDGLQGDLVAKIDSWFSGGEVDAYSGYFHCDTLP
jgi:hypothetical protein